MADAHEDFIADAAGGSGASDTVPIQAGALKKGSFVVLKGFPCKIVDYSTSKTGKHGHAKANITGIDIFTNKKYEDVCPTSHNMQQPIVNRKDYQLIDVDEENFVSLMDDKNETREDLRLDEQDDVHKKISEDFKAEKDLVVTVLSAMGTEKIIAVKEVNG
ncbi:Eukaryotic translation initiation factor 5A [Porphyridium purpureum]|uniref:Eukaryotic translation initiation factor 5A n=1 Tax=Porphyridium purpureum TaxID=35688 RepID=A0A5J4YTQ6_PORPP|nr:Eukaryotic translation initiation factor 5A [Porphyridium purpureum]|eukprot:POR8960..scf229_5